MTTTTTRRDAGRAPTLADVRAGLTKTLGDEYDGAWQAACSKAHVAPDATAVDDAQFDALLTAIGERDRLCHVLALSWRIRRTAARKLSELGR